ncbi:MAG: cytochrome c3 family protein [Gallionella sp.]
MKEYTREFGVKKLSDFSRSPWWIGMVFLLPLLLMMHFASAATSAPGNLKFDHNTTGFVLTGSHIVARCSSCHVDSVFKGTPRDCASCHVAGNRMGAQSKTTKHVATSAPCERCHQTTAWTPVKYNHVGVAPGSCLTCHNGTTANGKPIGHMSTNDSCDGCHKTVAWNQLTAGGTMPPNHLPTTKSCSLCHNQTSFIPGIMNHSGIVSGCANCHSGATFAVGVTPMAKPTGSTPHLPTNMPCEICHSASKTSVGGFAGTLMNHAGIVSGCTSCHNGQTFAVGVKPKSKADATPTHMTTSLDCSGCHTSTTTFLMANLTTPPPGHLPTTQVCSTCHSAGFGPGSGVMTHTGISTGCTNCHNGQVFTGVTPKSKPVNHLPTNMTCETCHSTSNFTTFSGTLMKHTGIVGGCTNCHNGQAFAGVTPVSKPTGATPHLPTNMSCETCHSASNFTSFSGTIMKHTGIASGCATCHGFVGAPKTFAVGMTPVNQTSSATHTAAGSTPCESCHSSTVSFSVATGGTKPANHLPTTAACTLCHGTPYYPGIMKHTGITSGCTTCHNGQAFAGVTPKSKPVNHLPTSGPCENCHTTANTNPGGFSGGTMNHVGIAGGCTNCHNGQAFAGVTPKTKSAQHIPYAANLLGGAGMSCEFCHSKTVFTSFTTGLVTSSIMHNGSMGKGSGQCTGCHLSGTSYIGVQGRKALNHESSGHTDCSDSGCHRPLGNEGTTYNSW